MIKNNTYHKDHKGNIWRGGGAEGAGALKKSVKSYFPFIVFLLSLFSKWEVPSCMSYKVFYFDIKVTCLLSFVFAVVQSRGGYRILVGVFMTHSIKKNETIDRND